ncbi:unnamed protein product [Notodromas monacha]|uniref:(3R)-3-hydroxyacyl-CoA dehydrogenase n=1 Tax=Notodromas monacha TaxID=399045 RepID=A0A7R9GB43_9CRUS|nr:unnamed protein product [Notodromas monacha]CAG0914645.1 unnamed protein product [Notodromas monacha]
MSATVGRLLLPGKVVFVTGAGSGLGRAICKCFAQEGATVIGGDVNKTAVDEVISSLRGMDNGKHLSVAVDVSSSEDVQSALNRTMEAFSKPADAVVNSAGITRDNLLFQMSEEDFDKVLSVNLKGTFLVNKIFGEAMVWHGIQGSIVNISSIVAKNGNIGQSNYAASKAGVLALSSTVAKELARHGIRVNSIIPGFIDTPMTEAVPDKVKDRIIPAIPLRRFGRPEEIAEVAAFLASDRSSYMTGAAVDVTGGLNL